MPSRRRAAALAVCSVAALVACSADVPTAPAPSSGLTLTVEVIAEGLDHPWDIGFLPDGQLLVTQRPGQLTLLTGSRPGARAVSVEADLSEVAARGEGGLLGLVVHPDFATSRLFTVCLNHTASGSRGEPADVRLVTWRLAPDSRSAVRVADLLTGLPTAAGGRHSGCRPRIGADGALLVGTGDTARGSIPQDRTSLGGKVLRLDLTTGEGLPDNPFASAASPQQRRVFSYGHRNIQGLALRPGTGEIYTAEHGPDRDDEVNRIVSGGNYGWDPGRGGATQDYDESVPMTDLERFPDAIPALWSTGSPTLALAGADFISGNAWGRYDGSLAVAALKASRLTVLHLDQSGRVTGVEVPNELNETFGRLRSVNRGPDGALYLTTDNGGGEDQVLRVSPTGGS